MGLFYAAVNVVESNLNFFRREHEKRRKKPVYHGKVFRKCVVIEVFTSAGRGYDDDLVR
jgi:hypothetical protein